MALHKFPKSKSFDVDYCGCTAATLLLNESSIRDAISFIRQMKSKQEFIKTRLSVAKDGVKIIYDDEQNYSTYVPAHMIAGSINGKSSLNDTIGVVYISPLTGRHYPAFVHVYRCDSSRAAHKLLIRLRAYIITESRRSEIQQLEQKLVLHKLLNSDHNNISKKQSQSPNTTTLESNKTNTGISSSSTSSNSRLDKIDPVKSITEELQKKIDSQEPLLFPPKDYDTVHAGHGNIQRAQAWKSREPTIIGYTPIDPDNHRTRHQISTNHLSSVNKSNTDESRKSNSSHDILGNNGRPRFSTQRSDTTIDAVEAVSLAFDFLKDETGSITTDNEGNIEPIETEQQDKPPIFRFRPPQITAITKKIFTRNNNYELQNDLPDQNLSPKNDLDHYYNNTHYHQHPQMPNGHRTRSETNLRYDPQPRMHLSPRYENRLVNRSGAPISTNPLWTSTSPVMIGSQPNLLTRHSPILQVPVHRNLSPPIERRMTSAAPLQHPLYVINSNHKSSANIHQQENQQKRPGQLPTPSNSNKKQSTQLQTLDTNEFILRASNGVLLKNSQYSNRSTPGISRDYRTHSIDVISNSNTMLDVYY
ncbi:unnamed protein product [Adineta steineri]|uniref:PID domain-containing protein n=1 Tax=Adineta steineri TaxID=433720 RepID=A0A813TMW3_9BILA|nr:unnamed protein product [Adineta steineri]